MTIEMKHVGEIYIVQIIDVQFRQMSCQGI